MLGWYGEQTFISDFWDKAEELPGCFMIQREIRKAVSGQSFFYNDDETGRAVHVEALSAEEFNHYFLLWDDFHWLHILPHGKGSIAERRWVLEVIKILEKTHKEVLNFNEIKNARQQEAEIKRMKNKG